MWHLTVLVVFVLIRSDAAEDCVRTETMASTPESRLIKDLLCGYDSDLRPVKDHRTAVNVSIMLLVRYVSFDEKEENLMVQSWLALRWKDEFLSWDPSNYGGLTQITIDSYKIWTPQLKMYNTIDNNHFSSSFYINCMVESSGNVACVPSVVHNAQCSTKIRNWPYDTQNCTLLFGSWIHKGEEINYTLIGTEGVGVYGKQAAGPGWALERVTSVRHPGIFKYNADETYPTLEFSFYLRRHVAGPAALVVAPAVVVIIVFLVSLLLGVNDYTRLSLSCFSLFGHFVIIAQVGTAIPKHSADTPILLLLLRDSMVLNTLGVLLTLLFTHLKRRTEQPHALVAKLTSYVSGRTRFAIYTAFEPCVVQQVDLAQSSEADKRDAAIRVWTDFCNILNTISVFVVIIVYVILLCCYLPKDKVTGPSTIRLY